VRKGLVQNDSVLELCVAHVAADLAFDFDQIEVDVLALEVANLQHSLHADLSQLLLLLIDDFASQGGDGSFDELVLVCHVDALAIVLKRFHADAARLLLAARNVQRVQPLVEQLETLLEQMACDDHDAGGAVADLVVL